MKTPNPSPTCQTSADMVEEQLEAYNARDLDAWLAAYSQDAEQAAGRGGMGL